MNIDVPYGITRRLPNDNLDAARARITASLQVEGFGVLTEIDVQKTLQKKLGIETPPYLILGACNPKLAHAAISAEPGVGLLLPCNVVLTTDGDDVIVSAASPKALFAAAGVAPGLAALAEDAEAKIRRAVANA
ncbi:MAG TPA: DUF302 domain-containing protein [Labilithrix sp.]|nr:DUF302 domain-containing protein [Labilithrix sp.]